MKKLSLYFKLLLFLVLTSAVSKAQTQLTNLPALYITTNEAAPITSKETWVPGNLTIAAPNETIGAYNGAIEIRGRGNSTWGMEKKPYRIRLASKYNLLGMPAKERNWVLLANYADKTLMRNALAFEISKFLGLPYSAPYRFVDVYLNDEYIGNYLLTDHIQVAEKRVEIETQKNTDTEEPAITGGYLVEADGFADAEVSKFITSRGMKFTIKSPDEETINSQQTNYITNFFQSVEDKLFASDFQDPQNGYMSNMDQTSLVNWYLACEITGNSDSFWSTYMFKKKNDDKIYFGPLWDFDVAFNNDLRLGDTTYKRMSRNGHSQANRIWIERMLLDENFRAALSKRWKELKSAGLVTHLNSLISNMKTTLDQSQAKNFERWPVLDTRVYQEFKATGTYDEHVEFMRSTVRKRMAWLELQLTGEFGRDTYYKIINKHSGKAMVPSTDSQLLVQQTFQPENNSHHWALKTTEINGIKYYTLTNRATNTKIMSPDNTSQSQLTLSSDTQNSKQEWSLYQSSDNIHFGFVNRESTMAIANYLGLDVEDNKVSQDRASVSNNPNQLWLIEATDVNQNALPIYTSGFQATAQENVINLSWQVYDNKNGDYFEIQRFTDSNFKSPEVIGQVPLTDAGIGKYAFTDKDPKPGINYYRLKQIDQDGSFTYSRIVSAKNLSISELALWPVPTMNTANISFFSAISGNGSMDIYNIAGIKLRSLPLKIENGLNKYKLDIHDLLQGLHMMRITYAEDAFTLKLMKINN